MRGQTPYPRTTDMPETNGDNSLATTSPAEWATFVENYETVRKIQRLYNQAIGSRRRNYNRECDYPDEIDSDAYWTMFKRGMGRRVTSILPQECWKVPPEVYEDEGDDVTPAEQAWADLEKRWGLNRRMARADILCGIENYGSLLLGFNDGLPLEAPLPGLDIEETDGPVPGVSGVDPKRLIYVRPLSMKGMCIETTVDDSRNARFGRPEFYRLNGTDPRRVHWSRVVHIADNALEDDYIGDPRMEAPYNILLDITKILGSSGEGMWQAGVPGIKATAAGDVEINFNEESVKEQIFNYLNGLQKHLGGKGVDYGLLAASPPSPEAPFMTACKALAAILGVPLRLLLGNEAGDLASSTDTRTWNDRKKDRCDNHLTPVIVRPLVRRLINFGVLPPFKEICVHWADPNTSTDLERADVAVKRTEALSKYVAGNIATLVPPELYFTHIMELPAKVVEQIVAEAGDLEELMRLAAETIAASKAAEEEQRVGGGGPPGGPAAGNGGPGNANGGE